MSQTLINMLKVSGSVFLNSNIARDINPKSVPFEARVTALTLSTIIEEIAFHSFLLQKIERFTEFWTANLINSALFVAIPLALD